MNLLDSRIVCECTLGKNSSVHRLFIQDNSSCWKVSPFVWCEDTCTLYHRCVYRALERDSSWRDKNCEWKPKKTSGTWKSSVSNENPMWKNRIGFAKACKSFDEQMVELITCETSRMVSSFQLLRISSLDIWVFTSHFVYFFKEDQLDDGFTRLADPCAHKIKFKENALVISSTYINFVAVMVQPDLTFSPVSAVQATLWKFEILVDG